MGASFVIVTTPGKLHRFSYSNPVLFCIYDQKRKTFELNSRATKVGPVALTFRREKFYWFIIGLLTYVTYLKMMLRSQVVDLQFNNRNKSKSISSLDRYCHFNKRFDKCWHWHYSVIPDVCRLRSDNFQICCRSTVNSQKCIQFQRLQYLSRWTGDNIQYWQLYLHEVSTKVRLQYCNAWLETRYCNILGH